MKFLSAFFALFFLAGSTQSGPVPVFEHGSTSQVYPTPSGRTGTDLDLQRSPSFRDMPSPVNLPSTSEATSRLRGEASIWNPTRSGRSHFDAALAPLPVARSDVVHSFLNSRFGISSNVPFRLALTRSQRDAVNAMADRHLGEPGLLWLHTIVAEPQTDLTYKHRLYVTAPMIRYDWKKALGLPHDQQNEHWLPVGFYKVDVGTTSRSFFQLEGLEIVRDPIEAMTVLTNWNTGQPLAQIAASLGKKMSHPPA